MDCSLICAGCLSDRYMTTTKMSDLGDYGDFKMSTDSVTTWKGKGKDESGAAMKVESGLIQYKGCNVKLKLRDTVGFGAKDMESADILKETVLEVAAFFEKIRGCILVHKCERYRTGGAKDVGEMKKAMKTLGLDFNKHLLVVITHSAHLSDEKQQEYSSQIRLKIDKGIPKERVIHVNFANLEELNEDFRAIYMKTVPCEYEKLLDTLMTQMKHEVAPAAKEFKEYFEQKHFGKGAPK